MVYKKNGELQGWIQTTKALEFVGKTIIECYLIHAETRSLGQNFHKMIFITQEGDKIELHFEDLVFQEEME